MSSYLDCQFGQLGCPGQLYNYNININTPTFDVFGSTEYGPNNTFHYPKRTKYSDYLERCGFKFPCVQCPNSGYYTNVHGHKTKADFSHPWAVIRYTPEKSEEFFQTLEGALNLVPKIGNWRIMNVITGQIAYEPGWFHRIHRSGGSCPK